MAFSVFVVCIIGFLWLVKKHYQEWEEYYC